jgi:hypothetical protein
MTNLLLPLSALFVIGSALVWALAHRHRRAFTQFGGRIEVCSLPFPGRRPPAARLER